MSMKGVCFYFVDHVVFGTSLLEDLKQVSVYMSNNIGDVMSPSRTRWYWDSFLIRSYRQPAQNEVEELVGSESGGYGIFVI